MWPFVKRVSIRADGVKNRVLLFFPAVDEPLSPKRKYEFPLSLVSLAPNLLKKNFRVHLFDERVQLKCRHQIEALLPDTICFGVSSMTGFQILRAIEMVKFVRNRSSVPIVWGGWHVTLLPDQSVRSKHVDYIVRGQGEATFSELTEVLANGALADLKNVPGITYKKDGEIVQTPSRPLIQMNDLEPMPYSFLDIRRYRKYHSYLSSIGCPMHCGFCADSAVYHGKWSPLEPTRVVEELEYLINRRTRNQVIFFIDSNFFVNRRRVEEICELILKRGMKFKWFPLGHPRQMARCDDHFFELLHRTGCYRLLIGAESGSQAVLDYIRKEATVEDNYTFVRKAARAGIQPNLSMMCGFPAAPEDDLRATITFMNEAKRICPTTKIKLFFFTPYPGSPLYEQVLKHGYKPPNSLEEWSRYTLRKLNMPYLDQDYEKLVRFFVDVYYKKYAGKSELDWNKFVRTARATKL